MVRDTNFSALKFMKLVYTNLINEPIVLIRENILNNVIGYLSYLKKDDSDRVAKKFFGLFLEKVLSSKDK